MLTDLGFKIRQGSAQHHVFKHPHLHGFRGGNFNCDNPVLPVYIKNIIKILDEHEDTLIARYGD